MLLQLKNNIVKFLNSILFSLLLLLITVISFIFKIGWLPYYIAAISTVLLLLSKADFTCLFPIFMLCLASSNNLLTINGNLGHIIILEILCSLVVSLIICRFYKDRSIVKFKLKKDFVFLSLLIIYVAMFLSLINTPSMTLSTIGLLYYLFILFSYFITRVLITPTEENKDKFVLNILLSGYVIVIECIYMLISKLQEGYSFTDILNNKMLSFIWCHTNHYAVFVNLCILLSLYYFIKNSSLTKKIFSYISIILFLLISIISVCRAGYLALSITIILAIIAYIIYIRRNGWESKKKDITFISTTIGLIVIILIFTITKGYLTSFISHFNFVGIFNVNGRIQMIRTAKEQFIAHPFIGSGVYTTNYFLSIKYDYMKDFFNYHNYYLQMLGTCGILGALAFTFYLIVSIKRVIKKDLYCIFVGIITVYFLIHGFLDTLYFNHVIMPILMVLLALIYDKSKEKLIIDSTYENKILLQSSSYIYEGEKYMDNTENQKDEIKVKNGFFYRFFKRMFDIISSGLFLILFSWLILILLFIKFCEDGHNPVYTSKRVGKNGRLIKFHKIRSMKPNADQLKQQLIDQGLNEADGPLFKMKDDPRITRFGKILRKTSLDEILQIWDVFVGRISVVGPRSPEPKEFEQFSERAKHKVDVKGGLLCLWQIQHNRNQIPFDEIIELDIKYIETRSLWLDLKIICKGFWAVLFDRSGE